MILFYWYVFQVTTVGDGFVFLGSRLGNSLLLRYVKGTANDTSNPPSSTTEVKIAIIRSSCLFIHNHHCMLQAVEPAPKRKRLNTAAEWAGKQFIVFGLPLSIAGDLFKVANQVVSLKF